MKHQPLQTTLASRLREFIDGAARSQTPADDLFSTLALELFACQYAQIPVYGRFCQARGVTPQSISDWRQIPALPTRAFQEFELSSLPPPQRSRVFWSSGTTAGERRSRHFHSPESLQIYEASLTPWFAKNVLDGFDSKLLLGRGQMATASRELDPSAAHSIGACRVLALTPPEALAPNSSLVYMFETVRKAFTFSDWAYAGAVHADHAWTLDAHQAIAFLDQAIERREPVLLLGPAFAFVHLLDHFAQHGLRRQLPAGSRVMETGGYKGRSRELSRSAFCGLLTDQLGITSDRIISEYGMSELSSQAYASPTASESVSSSGAGTGHPEFHFPPWARALIVSPETGREVANGEVGLIRVFDLANVYSVLAVQTEDLATRCDAGFALMGRAPKAEARGCSLMLA